MKNDVVIVCQHCGWPRREPKQVRLNPHIWYSDPKAKFRCYCTKCKTPEVRPEVRWRLLYGPQIDKYPDFYFILVNCDSRLPTEGR